MFCSFPCLYLHNVYIIVCSSVFCSSLNFFTIFICDGSHRNLIVHPPHVLLFCTLIILLEFFYYIFINPRCGTESQANTQRHRQPSEIDECKSFGSNFLHVLRIGKIRPVACKLFVSNNTYWNRDLIRKRKRGEIEGRISEFERTKSILSCIEKVNDSRTTYPPKCKFPCRI